MGSMSIVHWMIVIGVVVLLFGRGKISGLMGDVADGIKSFKKGLQEDEASAGTMTSPQPLIGHKPLEPGSKIDRVHEQA
jgi:sec-independent protein translocase protein TatA